MQLKIVIEHVSVVAGTPQVIEHIACWPLPSLLPVQALRYEAKAL